jgi:hypothetical protein
MKSADDPDGALDQIGAAFAGPSSGDDEIAREAYGLYCERGHVDGYDVEDWYEAERRVRARRDATRANGPASVN